MSQPETAAQVLRKVADAAARVAETEDGKVLFRYLHEKVNARSTYVPGDAHGTHLREGMRVLFLHIGFLINSGRSGQADVFTLAEQPPVWEQTRDVLHIEEEVSNGDY